MEILDTVITGAMLAVFAVALHFLIKGQIDSLRREMDGLRTEVRREIGDLKARVQRLEAQFDALRADLTQIALAVGAKLRPQTG